MQIEIIHLLQAAEHVKICNGKITEYRIQNEPNLNRILLCSTLEEMPCNTHLVTILCVSLKNRRQEIWEGRM